MMQLTTEESVAFDATIAAVQQLTVAHEHGHVLNALLSIYLEQGVRNIGPRRLATHLLDVIERLPQIEQCVQKADAERILQ